MRAGDRPPTAPRNAVPIHMLTKKQRTVLILVDHHERNMGEGCSSAWLARRLNIDRKTVQQHLEALFRKGWLRTPNAPALLRMRMDDTPISGVPRTSEASGAE